MTQLRPQTFKELLVMQCNVTNTHNLASRTIS